LAAVLGAGASCDAHHMTAPEPGGAGAAEAIRKALADAGCSADQIDFVNAHGTGTPHNDIAEWAALELVFGSRARSLPLTSTKSAIGHLLGAAGAVEAVATVACLSRGAVHPTWGRGDVDPLIAADLVVGASRELGPGRCALSTNLAFGGANAAVVFADCAGQVA
jgi:3-oxoacyl-[acyl-carrier-protein] synthase II